MFSNVSTSYKYALMGTINNEFRRHPKLITLVALSVLCLFLSPYVSAIAVPENTSFAFDIYDVVVNKILKGPIGFVGGLAAIVFGAAQLTKSWIIAVLGILSGTAIIKADSIVTSLGMSINLM